MTYIQRVDVKIPTGLDLSNAAIIKALNLGMKSIATCALDFWRSIAAAELKTSAPTYVRSITMDSNRSVKGISVYDLTLHGFLPVALEVGSGPFDMKNRLFGIIKGGNIRTSKTTGGRYTKIGMRHSTGRSGLSDSLASRHLHIPPPAILALMHKRNVITGLTTHFTVSRTFGYQSAVSRYEGLTKVHKKGWYTVRTMSEASAMSSWWHPGFKKHMFHKRVIDYIHNTLAKQVLMPLLNLMSGVRQ